MRLETIRAAGKYTAFGNIYYETITKEGDLLKKTATPAFYIKNNNSSTECPFYNYTKSNSVTGTTNPGYTFKLKELSKYDFFKTIFPDLQTDGYTFFTEKPFLLSNSGGEFIATNLKTTSLKFTSVDLITVDSLIVDEITEYESYTYTRYGTIYKPVKILDNFPNYDTNKNLEENFNNGAFEDSIKVNTKSFDVTYTKEIQKKKSWPDNKKIVSYSPYAILTPSYKTGLFSVEYVFAYGNTINDLVIRKYEYFYKNNVPATGSIIY